jgi:hypothetical protein
VQDKGMKKPLQRAIGFAIMLTVLAACTLAYVTGLGKTGVQTATLTSTSTEKTDTSTVTGNTRSPATQRTPLFAYYYIWFDPPSWDRAKIDLPQLGKYSSDDETVMRQHVKWAKEAGIDGFIVGWKSTDKLNSRLQKILRIADEEDFKILIIYQALDFERKPLTIRTISEDLDEFINNFMNHTSLHVFAKPVVIWSGTWMFSPQQVARVTETRRAKLLILGTSKTVKDYERIAASLDGNAYYWSSANVDTNSGYETKLKSMADAIHKHNGLWIAPAAPGFDARLVGGTQVVDRKDGETLRQQMSVASKTSPDAIGLISWNEFSENTYVEPSEKYGGHYLDVVKKIRLPS